MARILMRENAALPHVAGRWTTIDADIAAWPEPFVAPPGVPLLARLGDEPVGCVGIGAPEDAIGEACATGGVRRIDCQRAVEDFPACTIHACRRGLCWAAIWEPDV